MKKLILIILLLPFFAQAQINGILQKTVATGILRGTFGPSGIDTLANVKGSLTNTYMLRYSSSLKGFQLRSPSQVLSDIAGAPLASPTFTGTVTLSNFQTDLGSSVSGNSHWVLRSGGNARAAFGLVGTDGVNTGSNSYLYNYLDNGTAVPVFTTVRATGAISFNSTVTLPTPFTLGAISVLPTGTELNFVDGVTSNIQTQLDDRLLLTGGTLSGALTISANGNIFGTSAAGGTPLSVQASSGSQGIKLFGRNNAGADEGFLQFYKFDQSTLHGTIGGG